MALFPFAHDDDPVGEVLSRRQALALFGAPILLGIAGCSIADGTDTPDEPVTGCVARPELTEGPYYVDEGLNRSDIRADTGTGAVKAGALLALTFNVSRLTGGTCTPIEGATVDVWHADAAGAYSDVGSATGQDFLRGYQNTDASGVASFTTVYPGWYPGRAVHIHFKIRFLTAAGNTREFTSQLFFNESLTDAVYEGAPYNTRGTRTMRNSTDGIYQQGGAETLLAVTETSAGYAATFSVGLAVD